MLQSQLPLTNHDGDKSTERILKKFKNPQLRFEYEGLRYSKHLRYNLFPKILECLTKLSFHRKFEMMVSQVRNFRESQK